MDARVIHTSLSTWKGRDWCVEIRCPCLTCELWLNERIDVDCACKPCSQNGLKAPEEVFCWKTDENVHAWDKRSMKKLPSRKEIEEHRERRSENGKESTPGKG